MIISYVFFSHPLQVAKENIKLQFEHEFKKGETQQVKTSWVEVKGEV